MSGSLNNKTKTRIPNNIEEGLFQFSDYYLEVGNVGDFGSISTRNSETIYTNFQLPFNNDNAILTTSVNEVNNKIVYTLK